jgi:formamidopyrimidine-DNA glycosylase
MSPVKLTSRLSDDDVAGLFDATRTVLAEWTDRLRAEAGDEFPEKVTAFRDEMAVHGRFGSRVPCAAHRSSGSDTRTTKRITGARCQTEGKLLADRALSRLLKQDWPKSIDEVDR